MRGVRARSGSLLPVLVFLVLLTAGAHHARCSLNPDGIAYLQHARSWAAGRPDLAISGCWGPLAGMLMAPLLALGVEPLVAARGMMALSALLFAWAALDIPRRLGLAGVWPGIWSWLLAVTVPLWSIAQITPDLLLAAILCIAVRRALPAGQDRRARSWFGTGLLVGVAYLAKPVGLPQGVTAIVALVLLGQGSDRPWAHARRALPAFLAGILMVSLPWIVTLSIHYGRPVISTAGAINLAIAGPEDVPRDHPFVRTLHRPPAGRVTTWEDPRVEDYASWSPLSDLRSLRHALAHGLRNVGYAGQALLDVTWAAPLAVLALLIPPWRRRLPRSTWLALVPVAVVVASYLPFDVHRRYFYAAWPFLFAAVALSVHAPFASRRRAAIAAGLTVAVLTAAPLLPHAGKVLTRAHRAGCEARELAEHLRDAGIDGPVAGLAARPGGYAGLYVAWFLGEPWYGDETEATTSRVAGSGAAIYVMARDDPRAAAFLRDEAWRDLDPILFSGTGGTGFPLRAFARRNGG